MKRDGMSALSDSPSVGKEQGFSIKDVSQSLKLAGFFLFTIFWYEANSRFDELQILEPP